MSERGTIFALSSGHPPAGVAVIRISGPQAHRAGELLAGDLPPARVASVRALRRPDTEDLLDDALVLRFDGPSSATGDDLVELQCHGGRAIVDAVLSALAAIDGLRLAEPGEFTRRAFANGRIDLTEAEGLADLLEAQTESQRKAALVIAEGGLRRQIEQWQERILALSAAAERAIDYDEDDEELDPVLLARCDVMASELESWLLRPRVELLRDGVLVVVAGPPNAGKSSLVNAIAGEERAIVTDVPGTTRDQIEVAVSVGGVPIRLTDTAGIRDTSDEVEAIGVDRARRLMQKADILVWLGDPGHIPDHRLPILLHPKADVCSRDLSGSGAIATSAVTGEGIAILLERIRTLSSEILPGEGELALNRRQAELLGNAAEALRAATTAADYPILAEQLRFARTAFDRITGRAAVTDMLDALFSRFCLGK